MLSDQPWIDYNNSGKKESTIIAEESNAHDIIDYINKIGN